MGVFGGGEAVGVVVEPLQTPEVGAAYQDSWPGASCRREFGSGRRLAVHGTVEGRERVPGVEIPAL